MSSAVAPPHSRAGEPLSQRTSAPTTPGEVSSEGLGTLLYREGFPGRHGGGRGLLAEPEGPYKPRPALAEEEVWCLWEAAAGRGSVVTVQGERLRVLSPGRRGAGPGPDFRDAVLVTSRGQLLVGDVEAHLSHGGWRSHGHHRDPAYNGVVLHVVFHREGAGGTALELGVEVPTIALGGGGEPAVPSPSPAPFPCYDSVPRMGLARVVATLEGAGEARLREKARRLRLRLAHVPEGEVLYQGLLEALGYSANREPFRKLALSLPFSPLRRRALAQPGQGRRAWLTAALLVASGLGREEDRLRSGLTPLLAPWEWRRSGLRPANHPQRRLVGAAHLLHRFLPTGLVAGLAPLVARGQVPDLLKALTVPAEGSGHALIGRDRALAMVANVVLPFFYALALQQRRRPLGSATLGLYRALPGMEENEVTREVRRRALGGPGGQPRLSARAQQGMLHLYRHGCRWVACRACPLAGPTSYPGGNPSLPRARTQEAIGGARGGALNALR